MVQFSTVKPVLSGHSKEDPKLCFKDRQLLNAGQKYSARLMHVKSIAEYSGGAFYNTFNLH